MVEKVEHNLHCELCTFRPLLATYGIDSSGKLYVHIKVYKGHRIFGNIFATGDVKLQCRDCLRWHSVKVTQPNRAILVEERIVETSPLWTAGGVIK